MSIHIVLVEQDQVEAERLSRALNSAIVKIGWVVDSAQLLITLQSALPDLLLVRWRGSSRDLCDLMGAIRVNALTRHLPIIILSHYTDARSKIDALDAGADHYLVMPCDIGELQADIRALLRRVQTPSDATQRLDTLHLDPHRQKVMVEAETGQRIISLSPQEFRLLQFLVEYPGRTHTREELLDRVWDNHFFVSQRTVDVHVRKLRAALAGTLGEDLIETVRGEGYRLIPNAQKTVRNGQRAKHAGKSDLPLDGRASRMVVHR
ncbi:winged helix-turn-helix domain-containing protein [Ralstonia chuxiongensis]|uniref:winged helix-turn-helix domain-containing protein n=1 Tax=Ralstonia chuxiongensis TaxID=2957504 RepID=UPI0028F56AFA|nr:winged helix-turn-helix domain-containing protein [Ralstonia chuxiongensis]CAJ0783548.1 hypothetical protein R8510_05145 [Ralstonia chuxiongensis]